MTESIDYWFWYWGPYLIHTRIKDSSFIAELLEKAFEQRKDFKRRLKRQEEAKEEDNQGL